MSKVVIFQQLLAYKHIPELVLVPLAVSHQLELQMVIF